jgi:hypothetical protein
LYEELYEGLYNKVLSSPQVLEDEMFIGGIYVRLFLKNPQYNIRKPEKFVEVLPSSSHLILSYYVGVCVESCIGGYI